MFRDKLITRLHKENQEAIALNATWVLIHGFLSKLEDELQAVQEVNPSAILFDWKRENYVDVNVDRATLAFRVNLREKTIEVHYNGEVRDTIRFREGEMVSSTLFPEQTITEAVVDQYLALALEQK